MADNVLMRETVYIALTPSDSKNTTVTLGSNSYEYFAVDVHTSKYFYIFQIPVSEESHGFIYFFVKCVFAILG